MMLHATSIHFVVLSLLYLLLPTIVDRYRVFASTLERALLVHWRDDHPIIYDCSSSHGIFVRLNDS